MIQRACSNSVLVLAKAFPPDLGGVEAYSEEVAFAYARKGLRPIVITQFDGVAGLETRVRAGASIQVCNVGGGPQWLVFLRMLRALRRLKGTTFHFSHATTWRVSLPALLMRLHPMIVTMHGREIMQTTGILRSLMLRAFLGADAIGVISDYSLRVCSEVIPQLQAKAVVAWNGLSWPDMPSTRSYDRRGQSLRILSACQLTVRKNVAAAVEAIRILKQRGNHAVELRIAGDGPERRNLEALIRTLGLQGGVKVLGRVPRQDMPKLYGWADLFLHPQSHAHDSRDFESFCIAVADAMGFGLPTIAGADGAPSEYIRHGENGWLVAGGDPREIADVIQMAIESESLRRAIGQQAATFAHTNFSWDRHVGILIDKLNSSIGDD
jgi:phosphatidyl-myo-inositol dimannoside synthase